MLIDKNLIDSKEDLAIKIDLEFIKILFKVH